MLVLVMGHAGHAIQGSDVQSGRTGQGSTQDVKEWEDVMWMLAYTIEAFVIMVRAAGFGVPMFWRLTQCFSLCSPDHKEP
jgi:hypothetical protein